MAFDSQIAALLQQINKISRGTGLKPEITEFLFLKHIQHTERIEQ